MNAGWVPPTLTAASAASLPAGREVIPPPAIGQASSNQARQQDPEAAPLDVQEEESSEASGEDRKLEEEEGKYVGRHAAGLVAYADSSGSESDSDESPRRELDSFF